MRSAIIMVSDFLIYIIVNQDGWSATSPAVAEKIPNDSAHFALCWKTTSSQRALYLLPQGDYSVRKFLPFPRATLAEALKIPSTIKEHNDGNPWEPDEVRKAIGRVRMATRTFI